MAAAARPWCAAVRDSTGTMTICQAAGRVDDGRETYSYLGSEGVQCVPADPRVWTACLCLVSMECLTVLGP